MGRGKSGWREPTSAVGVVALGTLVVLGLFVWSGLLVWALLIVLVAGTTDVPSVVAALETAGYPARVADLTLVVEGMSCASCVGRVEKALKAVPGVVEAYRTVVDIAGGDGAQAIGCSGAGVQW